MEKRLDERTAPKAVPWLSIAGFTITFLGFIAVILGAFILYHVNPIKKDIEEVNRKIERDTQAMERRLTAEIESSRRDITAFKEEIRRENTWNYAYNNLRHDHNSRLIEKLWTRLYSGEPPAFQQPAKPNN